MLQSPTLRLLTTAEVLQEQSNGALLVDTRPAERFAGLYMPGAIQIGLEGPFASWAAILIRPAQPIVLLAANSTDAEEAQIRLARVGVKGASQYALADEERWRREGVSVASIGVHRCRNFHRILQTDPSIQVVDVRSRSEWLKGHLPRRIPCYDCGEHSAQGRRTRYRHSDRWHRRMVGVRAASRNTGTLTFEILKLTS